MITAMVSLTALVTSAALLAAPAMSAEGPRPQQRQLPDGDGQSQGAPPAKSKQGLAMFGVGVGLMAVGVAVGAAAVFTVLRNGLGYRAESAPEPDVTGPRVMTGVAIGAVAVGVPLVIVGATRNSRANRRLDESASTARPSWTPTLSLGPDRASFGVSLRF